MLTVLRMLSGQIPLSCNSTQLPLKDVPLLSVYHGKVSRGHHKILHNYQRTEYPENNLFEGHTSMYFTMDLVRVSQTPP